MTQEVEKCKWNDDSPGSCRREINTGNTLRKDLQSECERENANNGVLAEREGVSCGSRIIECNPFYDERSTSVSSLSCSFLSPSSGISTNNEV